MRIAVVGAGIAGMSAAWLLSTRHEVVVFESSPRPGGHSHTVDVDVPEGRVAVDTGFIVYNTAAYPNLVALFRHLGVATCPTSMGFAVTLNGGSFEYNGDGIGGFFGQRSNILSPAHWRMGADIVRFFREASAEPLEGAAAPQVSLGRWLEERRYGRAFIERHILPMGAAIWSAPASVMLEFPVASFLRFFANHGLLRLSDRPEWRTVVGGSRSYVERLVGDLSRPIRVDDPVISVRGGASGVAVTTRSGAALVFDRCLVACHADEARTLIGGEGSEVATLLKAFRYSDNEAVLHWDERHMPRRRRLWSAWNYSGTSDGCVRVTYWMNRLQPLATRRNLFVSLNPVPSVAEERVLRRINYRHPVFDRGAMRAQRELWGVQGRNGIWLAGSYFGYGFHECALQSGLAAAEDLGAVRRPWIVDGESDRLTFPRRGPHISVMAGAA